MKAGNSNPNKTKSNQTQDKGPLLDSFGVRRGGWKAYRIRSVTVVHV